MFESDLPRGVRVLDLDPFVGDDGKGPSVFVWITPTREINGPDQEPPKPGQCVAGHFAERTWVVPRDHFSYCARHLWDTIRRAAWPWNPPFHLD